MITHFNIRFYDFLMLYVNYDIDWTIDSMEHDWNNFIELYKQGKIKNAQEWVKIKKGIFFNHSKN